MTKEIKKCPNCGHQFKDGEEFCPNCDLFVPVNDQVETEDTFDPNETKQFKTFKEIEKETNENYPESRFKHRTKYNETSDLKDEETVIEDEAKTSEELSETEPSTVESEKTDDNDQTAEVPTIKPQPTIDPITPSVEDEPEKESPSSTTLRNETNKKKSNKKAIIGMSAAAILVAGGFTFYSIQQKNTDEKERVELISSTKSDLNKLFYSKEQVFLKEGLSQAELDEAKTELDKLKTKEGYDDLKELFDEIEVKFNKQQGMNDLFKTPIMDGKALKEEAFVKNADGIALSRVDEEKDGFDILFNKAFDEAQKQKETLKNAEDKLEVVFVNDDVQKSATRKQYQEAEKAINAVSDEEFKNQLKAQLKKVDTFLVEADKKKKAADEAEALAAQAAEQERLAQIEAENQQNNQNNANNNTTQGSGQLTGPSGNYRWGNREDAVIDYNDAAWAWAPGVQEKVISEVLSRGYVVEGGYTLVPKYVENGEGFYDLYATTNSKIFPKSKPEEFPLYVVTINAKTGWFKGNGPN